MTDLWSFLLQTLTASGAAVLLLVVKAILWDKLSPRWQFAAWGVLGLVLLVPAGLGGRHALVDWPFLVETVKSAVTGDFGSLTHVLAPVPLPFRISPASAADWLYLVYGAGVLFFLLRYVLQYLRLRLALGRAVPEEDPRVRAVAERYQLPVCPVVRAAGLSSAFLCGVFRPVLVLPPEEEIDEKILLHELTHLAQHDTAWGLLICFLRCLHWCNPLLWLCAGLAQNDLEARCDQRVLERLEGEERREYGHILLDLAGGNYACVPGTSSMANGAESIRRRVQAIARFKKYPAGMALVSVCILLALAVPLLIGTPAEVRAQPETFLDETAATMTRARLVRCTTCHGALDTYAKAVLSGKAPYRAMCAPLSEQDQLAEEYREGAGYEAVNWRSLQLPGHPDWSSNYTIYNLFPAGRDAYTCFLSIDLLNSFQPVESGELGRLTAVQPLRAEKADGRWVVLPLGEFRLVKATAEDIYQVEPGLPAWTYEAKAGDFLIQAQIQTASYCSNLTLDVDNTPHVDATFSTIFNKNIQGIYVGTEEAKQNYSEIGLSYRPLMEGADRPALPVPSLQTPSSQLREELARQGTCPLEGDWPDTFRINRYDRRQEGDLTLPVSYAADLYLDQALAAELTLLPVKGGTS